MSPNEIIQARLTPEMWEKVKSDMKRLGIQSESEYVRLMISGEITGITEIKDRLLQIESALAELKTTKTRKEKP